MGVISRFFSLRIFDLDRRKVLLRKYKSSKTWAMPSMLIGAKDDPFKSIEDLLKKTVRSDDWKLVSAVPVIDTTDMEAKETLGGCVIYDITYEGKFLDAETLEELQDIDEVRWVDKDGLLDISPCNNPTRIAITAMLKGEI